MKRKPLDVHLTVKCTSCGENIFDRSSKKWHIEYFCKCGYHTPISTGMMMHLSYYRSKKHGFDHAVVRELTVLEKCACQ